MSEKFFTSLVIYLQKKFLKEKILFKAFFALLILFSHYIFPQDFQIIGIENINNINSSAIIYQPQNDSLILLSQNLKKQKILLKTTKKNRKLHSNNSTKKRIHLKKNYFNNVKETIVFLKQPDKFRETFFKINEDKISVNIGKYNYSFINHKNNYSLKVYRYIKKINGYYQLLFKKQYKEFHFLRPPPFLI